MSNVAIPNPETTGDVPSAGGGGTNALTNNTVIVVAGASGDLAKKKVSPEKCP
jgi:glucose-6-phosphate 1-dehydrogenase